MQLNDKELQNKKQWEEKGFALPHFDRAPVRARTKKEPEWLHFGAGNIFRAYLGMIAQRLLDEGFIDTGIIVAEGYDYEIIDAVYTAYDDLSILVTLKADDSVEKTVIASVVESLKMDDGGFSRLKEIFAAESLKLVSLTITEKGYNLTGSDGQILPDVKADTKAGPGAPVSYMGKLAALCYHRYQNGAAPLALVSMDNCSGNGTRLYQAVRHFAAEWVQSGYVQKKFLTYVDDPGCLSFPWTMIDKITPRPDDDVARMLGDDGIVDLGSIVTAKDTYIAPFVNAEETEYLVIEDAFPNGRPPLEKAGVLLTDRETVSKIEKMKVCTCLNPLHTALAVFGCLLSYTRISETMKDPVLSKLVRRVADEGLPVVVDPKIISPADFIDTVINVRLPNPFMPDSPQRIATDTSAKIAIRFGETIKAYLRNDDRSNTRSDCRNGNRSDDMSVETLVAIPLVLAGWCRYLLGVDDNGDPFDLSPDPMLPKLRSQLEGVSLGSTVDLVKTLAPLLSNAALFGIDLIDAGIAARVTEYFGMMLEGPGAVRKTLESVLFRM